MQQKNVTKIHRTLGTWTKLLPQLCITALGRLCPISNPKNIEIARYSINFWDLSLYLRFGQIRPKSMHLLGEVISSTFLRNMDEITV